jgi:hypothetical protein
MRRVVLAMVLLLGLSVPAGADLDHVRQLLDRGEDKAAVEELRFLIWKNRESRVKAAEEAEGETAGKDTPDGKSQSESMTDVRSAAKIMLGDMFLEGRGVPRNYSLAWDWYWSALEDGNGEGAFRLGQLIEDGRAVPRYIPKAIEWYEEAAKRDHVGAMSRIAEIYRNGLDDILPDAKKAAEWSDKAAETRRMAELAAIEKEKRAAEKRKEEEAERIRQARASDLALTAGKVIARFGNEVATEVEEAVAARERGTVDVAADPALAVLAGRFAAVANAGDVEGMKKLLHPASLACAGEIDGAAYDAFLRDDFMRAIPEEHDLSARTIGPEEPLPFEKAVGYPVRPSHWVRYRFAPEAGRRVSLIRTLVKEGDVWFIVLPCFNPAAIRRMVTNEEGFLPGVGDILGLVLKSE